MNQGQLVLMRVCLADDPQAEVERLGERELALLFSFCESAKGGVRGMTRELAKERAAMLFFEKVNEPIERAEGRDEVSRVRNGNGNGGEA